MRKVILATAGVAVVAFVVAAMGSAQPTASTATTRAVAKAPVLPKLPAEIASRKRLIVGAKCDTPPFGYIDVRGRTPASTSRSHGSSPGMRSGRPSGSRSCAPRRPCGSRC